MDLPFSVDHSLTGQSWQVRETDDDQVRRIVQRLRCPEIVGRILAGRGVSDDQVEAYLDTTLKRHLPNPSVLAGCDKAAARLAEATIAGETIGIFGDYDVDGGTGSAILTRYLREAGAKVNTYIPDRRAEGYGPSVAAFQHLAAEGASVIVTVDCGTTSYEPLTWARDNRIDAIVVDHHLPGEATNPAFALINPKNINDTSGLDYLSAAGVSFCLTVAINRALREAGHFAERAEPNLMALLDLVALGTVCDVVPLKGLNRAFVTQGLQVLAQRGNPGLAALSDVAKVHGPPSTYHLGFMFGPRINAGGRLGPAGLALDLLTTTDPAAARQMARELDALNSQRRDVERDVLDAAILAAEKVVERGSKVVVVGGKGWHEGVVGIVAGRLKDRFRRPAVVLSIGDNGIAKGSGRSLTGVDLGSAVIAATEMGLLIKGGGHGMAAGMTVAADGIEAFAAYLERALGEAIETAAASAHLRVDGVVSLGAITGELSDAIQKAGPFGAGNPEPMEVCPNVTVDWADRVGADHVRATLSDGSGNRLKGIAFRAADGPLGAALMEREGRPLHLAGRIKDDTWNRRRQVQLQIEDAATT
jgi:single-stranded-DNA-specific exonuclease